jgi:hypothetical protein
MLYSQIANQPKEMQEKLYVWKALNLMNGPGMEVKSIVIDSPLVKVIKILYKYYFDQHSDKNFYYNQFFEGIDMYPNGIISMELITFYREILQETRRNELFLKRRDFPFLSQYGVPPKALDLTDRWAKKKFIWFTLAYNAHQELECFDSLENYQAAMLIKDAASMVSIDASDAPIVIVDDFEVMPIDASEVLPVDASEVLPVNAIDASEVMSEDSIDASEVMSDDAPEMMPVDADDAPEIMPINALEMMLVDAVDAPEVLPNDASDVMSEDFIDAPNDNEVLPNDASDVMSEDSIDAPDDNEVLPNDNEVMSEDSIDAPDDNEVMPDDNEVMPDDAIEVLPNDASDVMSKDSVDASEDNALQYMFLQKRYKDLQAKLLILQANKPKDQCEDQEYTQADDQGEDQEYVPDDDQEDSLDEGQQYAPDNDQEMEEEDPEKEEMDKKTALLAILNLRLIDMDRAIEPPPFPVAPRFKRCVALPQQPIVRMYTNKQQFIEEDKIPKNKSYSEWLPLQKICRVLPNTPEAASSLTNLLEMETVDLFAFVNSNEAAINRSSNAIIRYNVMKGQAIEQLVIRAKKSRSRSRICDVYADVNASLQKFSIEHNCGFVEINHKRMQELRVLGEAAEYLELEKYDFKCSFKKLIRRVPQIVKEAKSLKPVVEKRPAVRRRAAPAAKKQRVE